MLSQVREGRAEVACPKARQEIVVVWMEVVFVVEVKAI